MRLVALSTALALALSFALSSGTPAAAVPAKKPAATKAQAAASSGTTKQAATTKKRVQKKVRPALQPALQDVASLNPASPDVRAAVHYVRAETTGSARAQAPRMPRLFASSDPVDEARRWIGTNPTDMDRRWCARFMNFVLERSGYSGTGSDAAKSFASYGRRVSGPRVGAIAVMHRKNGGHVGIVSGIDERGNPIIISGNSFGRKVAEGAYPRSRIYAYVMPQ